MSDTARKCLSIVVPVYNEEDNVLALYHAVTEVMQPLSEQYEYELIFTDNHSTDSTFAKLEQLASLDQRVSVFRFSRNFGYQRSIITGYLKASGDAAIQLDCDMQDPPRLIPEFLRLWNEGYQVVYGVRRFRREGSGITFLRKVFYRLISMLSEDNLPLDAGDFRLVDRCVLNELRNMEDSQPYLRGAIAAMGFKQIGFPYDREERARGESKFSFGDLFGLAVDGILNHSIVPLRIATYTGLVVSTITFLAMAVYSIGKFLLGQKWPAGFATTTVLLLLSISLNALFLGIIGEYLGRIYKQVKKRPLTIIEKQIIQGTVYHAAAAIAGQKILQEKDQVQ
jgi:glycosyltransferase involved in cell wall biosynthesis